MRRQSAFCVPEWHRIGAVVVTVAALAGVHGTAQATPIGLEDIEIQESLAKTEAATLAILALSLIDRDKNAILNIFDPVGAATTDKQIVDSELLDIADFEDGRKAQEKTAALNVVGELEIAGLIGPQNYHVGTFLDLTYHPPDPVSGLGITGPDVAFVQYSIVNDPTDPENPDYRLLSTSSAASNLFAFRFMATEYESLIRATPFNALGESIFLRDAEGSNAAIAFAANVSDGPLPTVPEPSSLLLVGRGWRWLPAVVGGAVECQVIYGSVD